LSSPRKDRVELPITDACKPAVMKSSGFSGEQRFCRSSDVSFGSFRRHWPSTPPFSKISAAFYRPTDATPLSSATGHGGIPLMKPPESFPDTGSPS
jgi:hypothetical protein